MAVGDRFKVTVHQTLFTEPLVNVFCYEQTGGTGGAFELGTAFLSDVWDVVQTVQSDEVLTSHVEVINEDDDTDFSSILCTSGCAGTRTGDTMPRFVAWAFRLNRASRASRAVEIDHIGRTTIVEFQVVGTIRHADPHGEVQTIRSRW